MINKLALVALLTLAACLELGAISGQARQAGCAEGGNFGETLNKFLDNLIVQGEQDADLLAELVDVELAREMVVELGDNVYSSSEWDRETLDQAMGHCLLADDCELVREACQRVVLPKLANCLHQIDRRLATQEPLSDSGKQSVALGQLCSTLSTRTIE